MSRIPASVANVMQRDKQRKELATVKARAIALSALPTSSKDLEYNEGKPISEVAGPLGSNEYVLRNKTGEIIFRSQTMPEREQPDISDIIPAEAIKRQAAPGKTLGRPKTEKPAQERLYTIDNIQEKPKPHQKATATDPCHAIINTGLQCKNKKYEGNLCKIHNRITPKKLIASVITPQALDNIAPTAEMVNLILDESARNSTNAGAATAGILGKSDVTGSSIS